MKNADTSPRAWALNAVSALLLAAGLVVPVATLAAAQCEVQDAVTAGRQAAVQAAFDKANAAGNVLDGNGNAAGASTADSENSDYKVAGDTRTGAQNCLFDAGGAMGNYVTGAGAMSAITSILQKLGSALSSSDCAGQAFQQGKDAVTSAVENKVSSAVGGGAGGSILSSIDSSVRSSGSLSSGFPSMNEMGSSLGQAATNAAQNAASSAANSAVNEAKSAAGSAAGGGSSWSQLSSLLGQ